MMFVAAYALLLIELCTASRVPIYRYWNGGAGDHFYTASWAELGSGRSGWVLESQAAWYMNSVQETGTSPLYRYYQGSTVDHFYTRNSAEIGTVTPGATGNFGYRYEGVLGYCYATQATGTIPLHRYWNALATDHFYTTNWGELGAGRSGWAYEGVACYVYASDIDISLNYEIVAIAGLSWGDAEKHCKATFGTDLATISSDEEAEYLLDAAKTSLGGNAWIGLNDKVTEGAWLYKSGSFDCVATYGASGCETSYPYWTAGEPSNSVAGEDCAYVRVDATTISDMLGDERCARYTGTAGFFCDAPTTSAASYPWWMSYGAEFLMVLLALNLVMMCYTHCTNKSGRARSYRAVKVADSDLDESEAHAINV